MADVFLSYAFPDSQVAARLGDQLQQSGLSVFDVQNVAPGNASQEAISTALAQAKVFLLLVPGHPRSSTWVQQETQTAIARSASDGLPVLPVLLPGREPDGDTLRFRYLKVGSEHDFFRIVDVVANVLRSAKHASPSSAALRLSFLSSLLDTDLYRSPHAATLVLEEISQTVGGDIENSERQLTLLRHATEWGERNLGPSHPSMAALRYRLADALGRSGQHPESIELRRRALELSETSEERVELGLGLANQLVAYGSFEEATAYYSRSLELALASASDSAAAAALVGLGTAARAMGDLHEAQAYFERAVELTTRVAQPSTRTNALVSLCEVLSQMGDVQGGRRYADEALWLSRTTLAGNDALALRAAALVVPEDDDQ